MRSIKLTPEMKRQAYLTAKATVATPARVKQVLMSAELTGGTVYPTEHAPKVLTDFMVDDGLLERDGAFTVVTAVGRAYLAGIGPISALPPALPLPLKCRKIPAEKVIHEGATLARLLKTAIDGDGTVPELIDTTDERMATLRAEGLIDAERHITPAGTRWFWTRYMRLESGQYR